MSNLNILVIGASIAGPTAAYWLSKAGASVTVVERFPELRRGGQNIDIRTVGVTVMRRMEGMESAVRAALHDLEGISFVRDDGRPIAVMKATGNPESQSLVSEYEIFRGDLSRVIYDLTKDDDKIKYVFGEQVTSVQHTEDNGPVTVEFANGHPTSDYDLVVACDGATSRTRAMGLGCGMWDHVVRLNGWAAYFTIKDNIIGDSKIGKAYSAVGGRFLAIGPDPAGGTKVTLMGSEPHTDVDATPTFREAAKKGDEALKSYMDQKFRGAGWLSDQILAGMAKSEDFYATEMVQVRLPSLHRGRFVLVGDAGYAAALTGTGTSLALVGAYILAGELRKHKGDTAAGLTAYEERMRPMIEDMQKVPYGIQSVMAPQTAWGIWVRNILFSAICWAMQFRGLFAWCSGLFASSFGKDKYGIPEYTWDD